MTNDTSASPSVANIPRESLSILLGEDSAPTPSHTLNPNVHRPIPTNLD